MRGRPHKTCVPLFDHFYETSWGVYVIVSDDYVVFVRIRDGKCERFTWEQLGFKSEAGAEKGDK